ncbi:MULTISPECIES: AI-2E family transporter [Halorussus]|uniref:AI-2E family transporter n=1 Tax=Halorussus TaxID=1070314 RepID=UPI0020A0DCB7|nr:AI-2E family transporter [Halorussus vallis]USZ73972.1 AI-2E family transporter [Halorussus vallis]
MRARTGFAVVLTAVLVALSALVVRPFLSYVLAAILLAFVLHPVQERLEPRVGPRTSALALVCLAIAVVVVPTGLSLRTALEQVGDVPTSVAELPAFRSLERLLRRTLGVDVQIGVALRGLLDRFTAAVGDRASRLVRSGFHAFLGGLLLLFLLYYLLVDGERFVGWAKHVTPLPRSVQDELYAEAERTTWAVLKGHVFVAVVQGFVSGIGLFVAGVPDAIFWTVVMMFLAMVPIIGVAPVLGGATLYLLSQSRPLAAVLMVVYGMTVVAITDDYLRALVVDKESSLHSATVLLGVFGAAYLFGAVGLFVGPILLGLSKATIEVFSDYYDLAG